MTIKSNFPAIRPSLLLDFANTKTLDPRVTFTRASTATYYDGKTTVKAEENLLTYSQEFDNAIWAKGQATITANSTTAPDSSATADTVIANATVAEMYLRYTTSQVASTAYTVSVYAKAGIVNFVRLRNLAVSGSPNAWFNLSTGAVATVGAGLTASITSVGSGWYRCVITGTTLASIVNNAIDIAPSTADNSTAVTLNDSVYLWGAQYEQRSAVTAYTATTSQPITNYIPALQTALSNVARFDHNPTTGESLGLLIEEQRTNLCAYSQEFGNATWGKIGITVESNAAVGIDGTISANLLNGSGYIERQSTTTAQTVVGSVWVKGYGSGVGTTVKLRLIRDSYAQVITGPDVTLTDQWVRISFSGTFSSAPSSTVSLRIDSLNKTLVWGAQLEAGSFATSYIPTTTAQVTRSADTASMTGTNFSSWYRADEGTLYSDTAVFNNASTAKFCAYLGDSTQSNRIIHYFSITSPYAVITTTGTAQATFSFSAPSVDSNGAYISKQATAYKANDSAGSANSNAASSDTSVIIPIVSQLVIGASATSGTSALGGTVKKIAYYPIRVTNVQLQALTS